MTLFCVVGYVVWPHPTLFH